MSRKPLHALTWSQDLTLYELSTSGQLQQQFPPKDETTWLVWLSKERSFTFQGIAGSLYVYKEDRPRGGGYWYAYHTTSDRTSKRYLGRTTNVTFARLEEVAEALNDESAPPLVPASSEIAEHGAQPIPSRDVWSGIVLLSARLAHPLLPSSLVVRERLLTRLDGALSHRLTLLSASAGWGKTTLLSAWAARSSFPLSWLSLDELDNEPTRFWVSVLAALRTCWPGVGESQRISAWIMALPDPVIQEHAHLVLTASLYRVWSATSTVKALQVKVHQEAEQMMARVETALLPHKEQMLSTSSAEAALLHRRLQLLRLFIGVPPKRRGYGLWKSRRRASDLPWPRVIEHGHPQSDNRGGIAT